MFVAFLTTGAVYSLSFSERNCAVSLSLTTFAILCAAIGAELNPRGDVFARMQDRSLVVRVHAAVELGEGEFDAVAATHALSIALGDPQEAVRFYAAESLGKLGKDAAAAQGPLLEALGDDSWIVQRKVAIALGTTGVGEDKYFRRLKEIYPADDAQPHPELIVLYLAQDPPAAEEEYQPEDLTDKRWHVRVLALRSFFKQRQAQHAATMVGMLQDENMAVRGMAIHLFAHGDDDAQRALYFQRVYLSSGDFRIAGRVSSIGPDDIYSPVSVRRLYAHKNDRVQESLLFLIEKFDWDDDATREFLKRMAISKHFRVNRVAARLLDERMLSLD